MTTQSTASWNREWCDAGEDEPDTLAICTEPSEGDIASLTPEERAEWETWMSGLEDPDDLPFD